MRLNSKKWNNGNLELSPVPMKRARATHRERVDAPVERVFALLPPLFASRGGETHWLTTHRDDEQHRYGAVLLRPELAIGKLEVELSTSEGTTEVALELAYTAITGAGNQLFDDDLDHRMTQLLTHIVAALRGNAVSADELRLPGAGPSAAAGDAFESATAGAEHEMVVRADPDECFALACPVAELDWIDGWQFDLTYSDSGKNEDDCIFLEPASGLAVHRTVGANTTWYTTLYDTESRRFHAVLLTRDFVIGRWSLEVDDLGAGRSRFRWSLTYSGLNEQGNRIIRENGFEQRVLNMERFLALSAKRYLETGEIERLPARRKAEIAISLLGATVARHFCRPQRDSAATPER